MKIAVTGATGFVGTHLINQLLKSNHEVIASSGNADKAKNYAWYDQVSYVPYSISSNPPVENLYELFHAPEAFIHLAWSGLPNYNSLHHIEENAFSNYYFLKKLIRDGLKNLTVTGTCQEYGMKDGMLNEEMDVHPTTAYAVGKNSLNRYLEILNQSSDFALKWVRLFYLYGPGQSSQSLLPQLDKALLENKKVFNLSGGEQKRDFIHVQKAVSYLQDIAIQLKYTGVINCCSGEAVSVKDFIQEYLRTTNKKIELNFGFYPYPPYEPMEFWGDHSKLSEIIETK